MMASSLDPNKKLKPKPFPPPSQSRRPQLGLIPLPGSCSHDKVRLFPFVSDVRRNSAPRLSGPPPRPCSHQKSGSRTNCGRDPSDGQSLAGWRSDGAWRRWPSIEAPFCLSFLAIKSSFASSFAIHSSSCSQKRFFALCPFFFFVVISKSFLVADAFPTPGSARLPPPRLGRAPSAAASVASTPPLQPKTVPLGNVKDYLLKYGYVTPDTLENMGGESDDSIDLAGDDPGTPNRRRTKGWQAFKAGITAFQRLANLPETGVLDNGTMAAMQRPRCGMKDVDANIDFPLPLGANRRGRGRGRRQNEGGETEWQSMAARYQLQGSKWNKNRVTWKISAQSQDLARTTQENIFQRAFDMWSKYTPLNFQKVCATCPCDIEVKFAKWGHGDNDAFDGPSGVLAHAFYPRYGGDAHFDDDEFWTDRSNRGTNLFQVAVHEVGHSLGLKHSNQASAIMAPFYKSFDPNFGLQPDDIQGIQALYGVRTAPTLLPPFNTDTASGAGDAGVYYPVRPPSPWWWYSYYYGYRPYSNGGSNAGATNTGTSLRPQSQMGYPYNPFAHLRLPYGYGKKKK